MKLSTPGELTLESAQQLLQICKDEIAKLKPKAYKLRCKEIIRRLEGYVKEGKEDAAEEIRRIITRKTQIRWRQIGRKMRSTRQLPDSRVATKRKDGRRVVHADELDVKAALRGHLGNKRYKTARDAPIA